ncbi:hypothetical protein ACF1HJ_43815 [Streptomyces sp. NPDC013978]|uniref:hypothetical protein n=1 Tax=Streptomyces sp. NPDC013978 TaxID=3364869 RepID=UPI0037011326
MLNPAGDENTLAETTAVRGPVGALAPARLASPAERVLLDWLEAHIELQSLPDHDGVAGWEHRSVYEFMAAHGRWFTPGVLPAQVRPLLERQCFANAAATEQAHPHLAYTEGFAVAVGSPVPTAQAWCTDADGHVIDPTWSKGGGSAYLGIVLPSNVRPRASRTGESWKRPTSYTRCCATACEPGDLRAQSSVPGPSGWAFSGDG